MGVTSVNGQESLPATVAAPTRAPRPQRDTETVSRESQQPQRGGLEPNGTNKSGQAAQEQQRLALPDGRSTRLHVDPATKRIVAQILNSENEVIRQLPPEEMLKIVAKSRELQGLLFDRKA